MENIAMNKCVSKMKKCGLVKAKKCMPKMAAGGAAKDRLWDDEMMSKSKAKAKPKPKKK